MDIFGKDPRNKAGEYFRADMIMWETIHAICDKAIAASGLPFVTKDWSFNDGRGLAAQEHCDLLVVALKKYIKENPPKNGIFRIEQKVYAQNGTNGSIGGSKATIRSPFEVSAKEMKEFIAFLKNCGGFEID